MQSQTNCYALNLLGQEHCGVIHPPSYIIHFSTRPSGIFAAIAADMASSSDLHHIFENQSLECPHETCTKKSVLKGWNDGHAAHRMPHTIHDVNDVLLVSAIYACEDGHRILAHDARVLKMITSPSLVPFVLLHQTGFTKDLLTCVLQCVTMA